MTQFLNCSQRWMKSFSHLRWLYVVGKCVAKNAVLNEAICSVYYINSRRLGYVLRNPVKLMEDGPLQIYYETARVGEASSHYSK